MTNDPGPVDDWSAILFDLDGTLADTVPLIMASYRHAMSTHRGGYDAAGEHAWRQYIGRPLRDAVRHFARDEVDAEVLRRSYLEFQREAHDRMVTPFPGVRELLEGLEHRRVPLALVTSKAREMALRTLRVCGLENAFPVMITADEVKRGKPDPEPVHLALADLKTEEAGRVLFVGDSPHDVLAGQAAGVVTVAVTWGSRSTGPRRTAEFVSFSVMPPSEWVASPIRTLS
ncbi:MAG: HAD-IA family hydrolase [Gemmatimonadota bacterium]